MKTNEFILKIADLFLLSDEETADWVKIKRLRQAWYSFFFLSIFVSIFHNLIIPFGDLMHNSARLTLIYRMTFSVLDCLVILSLISMTISYFRHVISKNHPIYLWNILCFYIFQVIFFGVLYKQIYFLIPDSFRYIDAPIDYSPVLVKSLLLYKVQCHFLLFSACQSVNGGFYLIQPAAILPSILIWVQSIYTLSLIALLIASYVNQKAHPDTKKERRRKR